MAILGDLGFGLDLSQCALTGVTADLVWVSPKTGRAASREAGEPYRDRLLALPGFLRPRSDTPADVPVPVADIVAGFRLTGHFFQMHIYGPRDMAPGESRAGLIRELTRKN